jgi:hypothetical protein
MRPRASPASASSSGVDDLDASDVAVGTKVVPRASRVQIRAAVRFSLRRTRGLVAPVRRLLRCQRECAVYPQTHKPELHRYVRRRSRTLARRKKPAGLPVPPNAGEPHRRTHHAVVPMSGSPCQPAHRPESNHLACSRTSSRPWRSENPCPSRYRSCVRRIGTRPRQAIVRGLQRSRKCLLMQGVGAQASSWRGM